jgi:hypothetical protein
LPPAGGQPARARIQTDNDSSFGLQFTWHLSDLSISHRRIPPGCPVLVYADPERFSSNTPFQSGEQMIVSPVEGLEQVTRAAIDNLQVTPQLFDAIYLYYPMWNSRWLAEIWPTFRRIPAKPDKAY